MPAEAAAVEVEPLAALLVSTTNLTREPEVRTDSLLYRMTIPGTGQGTGSTLQAPQEKQGV